MDVRSLTTRLSRATDPLFGRRTGVTVLIHHRVGGGTDSQVDLPVAEFERQMEHLAAHADVISLDEAVERWRDPSRSAEPSVVLTFDDGTADFVEHALPVLERHRLPATLYLATDFVDTGRAFPWGAAPLSWSAVRESTASGLVTIGSHTHTHRTLGRATAAQAGDELDRSIDAIASNVGSVPLHFAYPKAVPGSPAAEIEVRRRFATASLARSRVNVPGRTDLHRVWRTPVQCRDGFEGFVAKAAGGMRLEGELRALALRGRSGD